jgi:MFS family permease
MTATPSPEIRPPAGPVTISWLGIGLLNFSWFAEVYAALLLGTGLAFVARRFTDDPRIIAAASTLGLLFRGSVGPFVNYVGDRVSTRWGRRRPIVVAAYAASAVALAVIPRPHDAAAACRCRRHFPVWET